jgi:hypothetical protein
VDKLSRMGNLKNFAWINFRESAKRQEFFFYNNNQTTYLHFQYRRERLIRDFELLCSNYWTIVQGKQLIDTGIERV